MITITRKFEFDAGHRVMGHKGKCRYPHGHRYTLLVTVAADDLNELGMVVDFGEIKAVIGEWIEKRIDHGFLIFDQDEELIAAFKQLTYAKICLLPFNPTAENLVFWLQSELSNQLRHKVDEGLSVVACQLYETPNCWANA